MAGAPGQLPAAPTLGKVTRRWPSPGTAPQPLRFQWNLNPVGNLSHFLLLPPQKRRGTAGHLSFPNKSHPTSLPGMGRPVAEARPPPRPQPEGKGRGLWRPEGRPRGARTPGRPRSPAASSVGGRGLAVSARTPLCSQVLGALCTGPNFSSQFGIRANPSVFLHACPLPGARSLLGNCLLSAGSTPVPSPIKLFISL